MERMTPATSIAGALLDCPAHLLLHQLLSLPQPLGTTTGSTDHGCMEQQYGKDEHSAAFSRFQSVLRLALFY